MLKSGMIVGNRYEILGKIGSGGMSVVYKGKDQKLNRYVAIKILKREYREDKNFVRKFREEAQAAACLAHPNIVNVYDVGDEQGIHYIVMELVEGITLKNYIERKGKLTIKEATSIAIQVSMGLEIAHNNDIVHRDIKPQNIMISKDGKVKVMDFGIAKAATSDTIASTAMGSVHYTSPEQARGGYSDAKSDIYSLGIVMYEMVTGRVPFDGETTVAVAVKHLQDEMPSPRLYCPELPVSLEQIILKCTEKIAAKRYGNMAELITDLKQSLQTPDEDFIKHVDIDEAAKTVMISREDLSKIKKETGRIQLPKSEKEDYSFFNDDDDDDYDRDDDDDDDDYDRDDEDDDYDYDDDEYEDDDDDDDEMDPRLEKIMTIGGIAAAVIILIMIVMLAGKILGFGFFSGKGDKEDSKQNEQQAEETVEMIDIRGKSYDDAKTALNQLGLGIESAGSEETDEYEEGQIIKQSVDAGTVVEKNTTIKVIVAVKEIEMVKIPDVTGQSKEDAIYRLEQEGFHVDYTETFHDTVKAGKVVKTSPDAGTEQEKGTTVYLTISKGPDKKMTTVPKVVGTTKENAQTALKNAKLEVGSIKEEYSDSVAAGNVISQSPSADSSVEEGVTVDLVVSKGPSKVTIPDLWGNPKTRAVEKLTALGLSVEVYEEYSSEAVGRVFKISPAEGEKVEPGSVVKIYLSKGEEPAATYKFSKSVAAPSDLKEGTQFTVTLKDPNGNEISKDTKSAGETATVSVSGKSFSSGTVVVSYTNSSDTAVQNSEAVSFTKE